MNNDFPLIFITKQMLSGCSSCSRTQITEHCVLATTPPHLAKQVIKWPAICIVPFSSILTKFAKLNVILAVVQRFLSNETVLLLIFTFALDS